MNIPYLIAACSTPSTGSPILISKVVKSTFPTIIPIIGIKISLTKLVTIFPKAAPMITPTAKSTTLPRITNALNSSTNFINPPKIKTF